MDDPIILARFVQVAVYSWVAPRQGDMAEGKSREGAVHGRAGRWQHGFPSYFPLLFHSRLQAYWLVPPVPRVSLPSPVSPPPTPKTI